MRELATTPAPEMLRPSAVRPRRRSRRVPGLVWSLLRATLFVAGPAALVLWVLFSPDFLVDEVEVTAGGRVSSRWVEESLAPFRGRHLLAISLPAVRERLADHPWVDVVEINKELPNHLRVTVAERIPVALWARDDGVAFVDRDGRVIAPLDGEPDRGLLTLEGPGSAQDRVEAEAALAVASELTAARPEWEGRIERLTLLGDGDYRVEVRDLQWELWVRDGAVATGLARLDRARETLAAIDPPPTGIDLRFAERIVIRRGSSEGPDRDHPTTKIDETEG